MSSKTKALSTRNKILASVTALVLGTATMTTGAMAFGHGGGGHAGGGGFGGGGHAMAMGHSMAAPSAAIGGGNFRGGNPGRFARGYGYGGAALGVGLGLGALAYGVDPYNYGYCGGYPGYYGYDTCSGYGW
jgi:hypothetical protein